VAAENSTIIGGGSGKPGDYKHRCTDLHMAFYVCLYRCEKVFVFYFCPLPCMLYLFQQMEKKCFLFKQFYRFLYFGTILISACD